MELKIYSKKYGTRTVLIDDEDYSKIQGKCLYLWSTARHTSIYAFIIEGRKSIRLHRYLLNLKDTNLVVDHKNRNALDNRKENLRITTQGKNNMNATKRRSAKTSKFKGVHYSSNRNRWIAQIQKDRKKYTSTHKTELAAAKAYNELASKFFGEFAVLNKIGECK